MPPQFIYELPKLFLNCGLVFMITISSAFAVDYTDPTPTYSTVPFNTTSGLGYGSFTGYGISSPINWLTTQKTIISSIKTRASTEEATCLVAYVDQPPTFHFSGAMILPLVDTKTYRGYWIYQSFVDDVHIHENWHLTIHKAYANGPWAALESWLGTYESAPCLTAEKAKANAKKDIQNAFKKVEATEKIFRDKKRLSHPIKHTVQELPPDATHTQRYLKLNNPDWGQPALTAVKAIKVTFEPPIECDCCKPIP